MKEKAIVSTLTLLTSLGSYMYAREAGKDAVPCMMVGGFIGTLVGEMVAEHLYRDNNEKNN